MVKSTAKAPPVTPGSPWSSLRLYYKGLIREEPEVLQHFLETQMFYRRRAFEPEASLGAMLWRAFDKPLDANRSLKKGLMIVSVADNAA